MDSNIVSLFWRIVWLIFLIRHEFAINQEERDENKSDSEKRI